MMQLLKTTMTKLVTGSLLVVLALFGVARIASATTLFDGSVNTDAACGSGGCFGLTYELIITDANDADATTFTGTIKITGTYTGTQSFIGAVDFKPDGNTILSATLTAAPGGTGGWDTAINLGQAQGDCAGAGVGFICSDDTGNNDQAPVTNGSAVNYTWSWNFSMNSAVDPGHLGACFDVTVDSQGTCVSADTFGSSTPSATPSGTPRVPEPSTLILLGVGLVASRMILKRVGAHKA